VKFETVETFRDTEWIHGHDIFEDGTTIPWMKLIDTPWVSKTLDQRLKDLKLNHVPIDKIKSFENMIEENIFDGWYYALVAIGDDPHKFGEPVINWLLGFMSEYMKENSIRSLKECVSAKDLNVFISNLVDEKFNKSKAKDAFIDFIKHKNIEDILTKYKVADASIIDTIINDVFDNNVEMVAKAKVDPRMINWLVGQVMKGSKGTANAGIVKQKVEEKLNG